MKIEELNLEERIGQMFIVGMNTSNIIDKIDDLILKYKIGGILLYKKNYKNCDQLIEIINYIKKLNMSNKVPILIAIDQEGGRVNRMPEDFKNIPAAYKLASSSQEENLVKKAGEITAQMLAKIGVNMDLAPVLDVKRFENQHAIGDRAFSEKKEEVSKYGITYMKELQKQNIISVIKHFPGHGATTTDSHFKLPIIKTKMEELEIEEVKQSPIKQARVNRSVKRILALKEKYNIEDKETQADKKWIEETNKKIQKIKDKVQKS